MLISGFVIAALYFGRDIFVPFALAVLLSFLLAAPVRWLRKLRLGRVTAVVASVTLAFITIFGFGAIVTEEVASLGKDLPEYQHNIRAKIRSLHVGLWGVVRAEGSGSEVTKAPSADMTATSLREAIAAIQTAFAAADLSGAVVGPQLPQTSANPDFGRAVAQPG